MTTTLKIIESRINKVTAAIGFDHLGATLPDRVEKRHTDNEALKKLGFKNGMAKVVPGLYVKFNRSGSRFALEDADGASYEIAGKTIDEVIEDAWSTIISMPDLAFDEIYSEAYSDVENEALDDDSDDEKVPSSDDIEARAHKRAAEIMDHDKTYKLLVELPKYKGKIQKFLRSTLDAISDGSNIVNITEPSNAGQHLKYLQGWLETSLAKLRKANQQMKRYGKTKNLRNQAKAALVQVNYYRKKIEDLVNGHGNNDYFENEGP